MYCVRALPLLPFVSDSKTTSSIARETQSWQVALRLVDISPTLSQNGYYKQVSRTCSFGPSFHRDCQEVTSELLGSATWPNKVKERLEPAVVPTALPIAVPQTGPLSSTQPSSQSITRVSVTTYEKARMWKESQAHIVKITLLISHCQSHTVKLAGPYKLRQSMLLTMPA